MHHLATPRDERRLASRLTGALAALTLVAVATPADATPADATPAPLAASPASDVVGAAVQAATVTPDAGEAGTLVRVRARGPERSLATLQRRGKGGWRTLGQRRVDASGAASFATFLPSPAGPVAYRVRFQRPGRSTVSPGVTAQVTSPPDANPWVLADVVSDATTYPSQQVMDGVLFFAGWVGGRQGLWRVEAPGAAPALVWGGATNNNGSLVSLRRAHRGLVYFEYEGHAWATSGAPGTAVQLTDHPVLDVTPVGVEVVIRPPSTTQPTFRSDGTPAGTRVHQGGSGEPVFSEGALLLEEVGFCGYGEPSSVRADDGARQELILQSAQCEDSRFAPGVRFAGREWFAWSPDAATPTVWSTDGTTAGTHQELLASGESIPITGDFAVASGLLYLESRKRIVVTDGTPAGTSVIRFPAATPPQVSSLFSYQGGVLAISAEGMPYQVPAGGRSALALTPPPGPERLDEPLDWQGTVVGEWEEYDGLDRGGFVNKLYAWDPRRPSRRFPSGTFAYLSARKVDRTETVVAEVRVGGMLLPRPGERVTVIADGRVVGRPRIGAGYRTKVRFRARSLGVGRHVLAFRYDGGEQLAASPAAELTVRVTR